MTSPSLATPKPTPEPSSRCFLEQTPPLAKLREMRGLDARTAATKARELRATTHVGRQHQQADYNRFQPFRLACRTLRSTLKTNPFAKATIALKSVAREERDPFTLNELNAIFTAPIFTGCELENHWKVSGKTILRSSAKFWVPLLALYTGARLNELCKLRVRDIKSDDNLLHRYQHGQA